MVRRICGRPSWLFAVASLVASWPPFRRSLSRPGSKGVVADDKGQPVADARFRSR